jgi:hypothetical protein
LQPFKEKYPESESEESGDDGEEDDDDERKFKSVKDDNMKSKSILRCCCVLHITHTTCSFNLKEAIEGQKLKAGIVQTKKDLGNLLKPFISKKLFSGVKFFGPPISDETGKGSVCQLIAKRFNALVEGDNINDWWHGDPNASRKERISVKNLVVHQLNKKRSTAAQQMKRKFLRKFDWATFYIAFAWN